MGVGFDDLNLTISMPVINNLVDHHKGCYPLRTVASLRNDYWYSLSYAINALEKNLTHKRQE